MSCTGVLITLGYKHVSSFGYKLVFDLALWPYLFSFKCVQG